MSRFDTMNQIGSDSYKDLSDNAKNLDIAVNDIEALKWEDRFGAERKTWHGIEKESSDAISLFQAQVTEAIADIGFFVPVPYASGISVTQPNFTVVGPDQVVYAAQPGLIPFTTGAWNPEQWYPIQNTRNPNALLVFYSLSEAQAVVATLPDGQEIESPDDNGRLSRFKVNSGALDFVRFLANVSEVEVVGVSYRLVTTDDSGSYLRCEASGEKNIELSGSSNLLGGEEIEVANRSLVGVLSIFGNGVTINPMRGGTLSLAPGDTVKLKAISSSVIDVLYGSTTSDRGPIPAIADENATFNDEGESTAGWTATGATMTTASSYLRATKTGAVGAACSITKPWTFTPAGRDFILYGKARASAISQFDATVFSIFNGTKEIAFWLGSTGASSGYAVGASGIIGYEGTTRKNSTATASGLAYSTTAVEFALQFDSLFGQLNCWFRESDGRWKLKTRLKCDFVSHTSIAISKHSDAPNGSWFEFDYLTLCRPNIIAIGDSHCAGAILFDPNLSLALGDDESTWMRYAKPYPSLRNNLIVNKGIGGQTSAQITARISEVTRESPRTVFLHASSNDTPSTVAAQVRTANIQSAINSISTSGQKVVLLNSLYATSTYSGNPGYRDYMRSWWNIDRRKLNSVSLAIDIMNPVIDVDGFLSASNAQPDKVHLTPSAYSLVGGYITNS
jgi:lysophospholipase L1-like esterase